MKNIEKVFDELDENLFASTAKLAGSALKSAASVGKQAGREADKGMLTASSKLDAGTQSRDNKTVQQNKTDVQNKFNYLKYTYYMIRHLEKANGETIQDKLKDQDVYKTYVYLGKLEPFVEKVVQGKDHWKKLFDMVGSPDSVEELISVYNMCVKKAGINGIPEIKGGNKGVVDQWLDIAADYDTLKKYAAGGDKTAKQILSFFTLFPESRFIDMMSLSILKEEDEDVFANDNFDKALAYIKAYKSGEGAIGKILAAMKDDERFTASFKKRVNKFYNQNKDDAEKKQKMASAGLGKKTEQKPEEKSGEEKPTEKDKEGMITASSQGVGEEEKSDEEEEFNLKLTPSQFAKGLKRMGANPSRFKLVNKEVLDATPGTQQYLDWNEFKKILSYIQNPDDFEEENKKDTKTDLGKLGRS